MHRKGPVDLQDAGRRQGEEASQGATGLSSPISAFLFTVTTPVAKIRVARASHSQVSVHLHFRKVTDVDVGCALVADNQVFGKKRRPAHCPGFWARAPISTIPSASSCRPGRSAACELTFTPDPSRICSRPLGAVPHRHLIREHLHPVHAGSGWREVSVPSPEVPSPIRICLPQRLLPAPRSASRRLEPDAHILGRIEEG